MKYRTHEGRGHNEADQTRPDQTRPVTQKRKKTAVNLSQTIDYEQPRRPAWCRISASAQVYSTALINCK